MFSNTMATLIEQPAPKSPPPLAGKDKEILDLYYTQTGVIDKPAEEKIRALQRKIGPRQFFAFGEGETIEMELRSNEQVYLILHAQ